MNKKELSGKDFLLALLYCPGKDSAENAIQAANQYYFIGFTSKSLFSIFC
jgi:hypothetical protein